MSETESVHRRGLSQERLRYLSRILRGYIEYGEIAGFVTLMYQYGEEAYFEATGWRDKEAQLPIQRDTIFRLMSMTKPITAVAALILVDEGKLRLHDPVDAWLPELANRMVMHDPYGVLDDVYPAPRSITLHDLLTYRLGIGTGTERPSQLGSHLLALTQGPIADILLKTGKLRQVERLDPDAWIARMGEFPLLYEPGERWLYNVASDILGVLVARVAGMPLEAFLHERIFEPLRMVDTSFSVPPEKRSRLSVVYAPSPTGELTMVDHQKTTPWANPPLFPSGSVGLVSTVDDYQRFGLMLLRKGELDGVRILSRQTVEAMTTDYLTPEQHTHGFYGLSDWWDKQGFGYGVSVQTKFSEIGPSVGSFSWAGIYGTFWISDPQEDLTAILMIQLADGLMNNEIGKDFLTLTYQASISQEA